MFSSMQAVEKYLLELVPKTHKMMFTAANGIARTKEYLHLLGSPQNKLKVIHIAGTSGKGSTSYMISSLLISQGFKTGFHASPHLTDVRERIQINNGLISEQRFVSYFSAIVPSIEKMRHTPLGDLTYFEALVGLAYYVFAQEQVDYAVIETGLGGLYDGTNVVDRHDKLSVITRIGFDHMQVLGDTLSKIAYQKAMICAAGGDLITGAQYPTARKAIEDVVKKKRGHLFVVDPSTWAPAFVKTTAGKQDDTLGLKGEFQKENAALAMEAVIHVSIRDAFVLNLHSLRLAMKNLRFKGRFDVIQKKGGEIILDGAHNVQKMRALLKSIRLLYPNKKFTFVLAFKHGKDYKKMLSLIIPFAKKIIITHIFSAHQDLRHLSTTPEEIKRGLKQLGFTRFEVKENLSEIVKTIKKGDGSYIVTGSLYLLGDIYKIVTSG